MHMTDEDALVEELARAICAASGDTWREGPLRGPGMGNRDSDSLNNHWRHKARTILPIVNARLDAITKERDELRAKTLKVENCILCADECRGHSLGDSAAWEPEEGSRDWLNFQLAAAQEKLARAEGALVDVAASLAAAMPTVEERAREALNAVSRERDDYARWDASDRREDIIVIETTCRLIEEFDAFKQEVSDAVDGWVKADRISADARRSACEHLVTFIIPKPVDPLVEAIREASVSDADDGDASRLRAALAARGGKIVWENANAR